MKFNVFGDKRKPAIIILHGGGLSCWSVEPIANILKDKFYLITPIIDGHGEDAENNFISIRNSAENLINYIDKFHSGKIHALCGLSIGAQIVVDTLSLRDNICNFSIVESALTIPMKITTSFILPLMNLAYPLIKMRWYSDIQAKYLLLPSKMYEIYYKDSCKISKLSLNNIIYSNSTFDISNDLRNTKSKVLILFGTKEIRIMKKSAYLLSTVIPNYQILPIQKYGHGELSQLHPEEYCNILLDFIN